MNDYSQQFKGLNPIYNLLILLVFIISLASTFATTYWMRSDSQNNEYLKFVNDCTEIEQKIITRLKSHEQILLSGAAMFEASTQVTREDFQRYTNKLRLNEHFNGIQGLAFAKWIPANQLQLHQTQIQAQGFDNYFVFPKGNRDFYAPVVFIEPFTQPNLRAFGYDIYSEPIRREAMEKARDENLVTISKKIMLVQGTSENPKSGILMFAPVYEKNKPINNVQQRQAALFGWIDSPFMMADLLNNIMGNQNVDLQIYDGISLKPENLLFSSSGIHLTKSSQFTLQKKVIFNGSIWTLNFQRLTKFDDSKVFIVAILGTLISFLLLFVLISNSKKKIYAYEIANQLTSQLKATLDAIPDLMFELGLDGHYYDWHAPHIGQLVASPSEFMGKKVIDILPIDVANVVLSALEEANETGYSNGKRINLVVPNGQSWFELSVAKKNRQVNDTQPKFIVLSRDITKRKQHEIELSIAAKVFESQEGVIITDSNRIIIRVNKSFTVITGYSEEEVVGQNPRILSSGRQDKCFYDNMWRSIYETGFWKGEIWNKRKNGEIYPEWLTVTVIKNADDVITHYVATLSDITARKLAESEIERLAFYDELTKLPNRRLLQDTLKIEIATSKRTGRKAALLFIDLDNFKNLNDTLGHSFGDLLLKQVSERLKSCVRTGDAVARFGGDEFVIMLENLSSDVVESGVQTESIARTILAKLSEHYQLENHIHHCTSSIGITIFDGHIKSIEELFKHADIAMYEAKKSGRNTFRFYDPKMQEAINFRATLEKDLHKAVIGNQFILYYQAQVSNGNVVGAEVLIRWRHPERGMIPPDKFISLAEETDLILPIGQWVLETACHQIKDWQNHPEKQHLQLAVNVSAKQFYQPNFIKQVQKVLNDTNIQPSKLKLELTETLLLESVEDTISIMVSLRQLGVRFSMDDFGTGYSSLSYLTKLPLDQLKIDQSFVRNIGVKPTDAVIVQTIIGMAQNLGMEVIAEGVETESQRDFLEKNNCFMYQGYFFSKPIPLEEFELLKISQ
jgi:diguanylate cyclase (GGDEF)-like protein/PAS domain S-box-containing protein